MPVEANQNVYDLNYSTSIAPISCIKKQHLKDAFTIDPKIINQKQKAQQENNTLNSGDKSLYLTHKGVVTRRAQDTRASPSRKIGTTHCHILTSVWIFPHIVIPKHFKIFFKTASHILVYY
jgi:hypothetical protein